MIELKVEGAYKCKACDMPPVLKEYNVGRYKYYCIVCPTCGIRTRATTNVRKILLDWNKVMK